jgi:large subunit ribosomal protein L9
LTEKRELKRAKEAKDLAKRVENIPCTIPVKVSEENKLFGSVGNQEIVDFLAKEGFEIERRAVQLDEPIKELGVYEIGIKLHKDVTATLKVWVVKDEKA